MRRSRAGALPVLLAGACLALLAGCDARGSTTRSGSDRSSTDATATTVSAGSDPTGGTQRYDGSEFCATFRGLSERKESSGDGFERYPDEAAWIAGIATVERIAATAPPEIAAQARTYAELVEARRGLAATYGYQPVPQSAKLQFGRAHADQQRQANELIAFAKEHCTGVS